jgi:predicted RNase H-like HicB family nuclease
MHRFLIVVERAGRGYSAYSPDLPGCVATGRTHDEVTRHMFEAIEMHLQGMSDDNLPVLKRRAPIQCLRRLRGSHGYNS